MAAGPAALSRCAQISTRRTKSKDFLSLSAALSRSSAPARSRIPCIPAPPHTMLRFSAYENRTSTDLLKYFYDRRLVRPPQIPQGAADRRHRGELADRLFRILLSGACQSHRLRPIHRVSTEDHSGSGHPVRLRGVRVLLSGRKPEVELRLVVPLHRGRGDFRVLGQI